MSTEYSIEGICQIAYKNSEKIDEIYVSVVVKADSEVEAITTAANDILSDLNYESFVWQQLSVSVARGNRSGFATMAKPAMEAVIMP